jgi:hypothetical protein
VKLVDFNGMLQVDYQPEVPDAILLRYKAALEADRERRNRLDMTVKRREEKLAKADDLAPLGLIT